MGSETGVTKLRTRSEFSQEGMLCMHIVPNSRYLCYRVNAWGLFLKMYIFVVVTVIMIKVLPLNINLNACVVYSETKTQLSHEEALDQSRCFRFDVSGFWFDAAVTEED